MRTVRNGNAVKTAMWREGHKWWPASDYDDAQEDELCEVMLCGAGITSGL